MLYLVGETEGFDAARAHRETRTDSSAKLQKLAKGVYCDDADLEDLSGFMKKNAIRIASYMLPDAVLSHASAYYKSAIDIDSDKRTAPLCRLFVSGAYLKVFSLPYLEIVQSWGLKNKNHLQYCRTFKDGKELECGELKLQCSIDELVFLQNFGRRRTHPERFLSDAAMTQLRRSLEDRYGSELVSRLRIISSTCGDLGDELDRAIQMLSKPIEPEAPDRPNLNEFTVAWHRRKIAKFAWDGMNGNFAVENGWLLPMTLSGNDRAGKTPAWIQNMMPEGFSAQSIAEIHLANGAKAGIMEASQRYMSNLVIVEDGSKVSTIPEDRLYGRLKDYAVDGTFTGKLHHIPKITGAFPNEICELVARESIPRITGFQPKVPMHLTEQGELTPAENKAFTHILKLPGITGDRKYAKGAVEWASMEMSKAGGVKIADTSMVKLQDGVIGLLSERFDVCRDEEDMRMLAAEDFCSIFGIHPNAKYGRNAEQVAEKLRSSSTSFVEDGPELFRQICANLFVENGDFHLKNISMIKVASPILNEFRSVRLAPAYDIMCTKFFGEDFKSLEEIESMVFKINGKDIGITLNDLQIFAAELDIEADMARKLALGVAEGMMDRAREIFQHPPSILTSQPEAASMVARVCERVSEQIARMFPELDTSLAPAVAVKKRKAKM